jgi:hypothetical protein
MNEIVIVPIGYFKLKGKKYFIVPEEQLHDVSVAPCVDVDKVNALLEQAEAENNDDYWFEEAYVKNC